MMPAYGPMTELGEYILEDKRGALTEHPYLFTGLRSLTKQSENESEEIMKQRYDPKLLCQ